jgi:Flp pilus assembly protein TadG
MTPRVAQAGAVVVELALSLTFLLPIAAFLLFYGRVLYNYEVAQKATHDAVRYLSSASVSNMSDPAQSGYEIAVAQAIVRAELSVLNPSALSVAVSCDGFQCAGFSPPSTVAVSVQIRVNNDLPGYATEVSSQVIQANHSMRYVGN